MTTSNLSDTGEKSGDKMQDKVIQCKELETKWFYWTKKLVWFVLVGK